MVRLYLTVSRVFIWLGNSLPKTERALELLMYLGDIPQEKYEVMRQHNLRFTWRTYEELGMEIITHRDWNILCSFL